MAKHEPTDYPWTQHGNRDGKFYAERNGEEIQIAELGEPVPGAMSAERYVDVEREARSVDDLVMVAHIDPDEPHRPSHALLRTVALVLILVGLVFFGALFLGWWR